MFRMFYSMIFGIFLLITPVLGFADCCQSADVSLGWRRDYLHWKLDNLNSSYVSADATSKILFKDLEYYTVNGRAKWVDSEYYFRFTADYGTSIKGRAHEHFHIHSPYLYEPVYVDTNDRIKRRSEAYDFNIAAGYPFAFCECRLSVVPLIGFSFHRQHIRVKEEHNSSYFRYSYDPSFYSSSNIIDLENGIQPVYSDSSSFGLDYSYNAFAECLSSDPFSDPSDPHIASALGLSNHKRTSVYRFTWYGFYVGTDIAYALDSTWTLFTELEYHFIDNCHRKRKSRTGIYFVDSYHHKGWAHGFNGVVGVNYEIGACWYGTMSVDFNYWKADTHKHHKRDDLEWKTVGAKLGLGYTY